MSATPPLPIDELMLETAPKKGKPPVSRLRDAKSAHELYRKLLDADDTSSANRSAIQAMFDGEPPYDDGELEDAAQGYRTNLNFGEAETLLEQAQAAYVDVLHSVETLVSVKVTEGEPSKRVQWEDIISEEVSRAFRAWPAFNYNYLANCRNFIADGVSVSYFENELDWRWRVSSLAEFFIPRQTQASESEIEVAACVRSFQAHQLYQFVKDPKVAEQAGWNVDEVRRAISEARSSTQAVYGEWEKVQRELKNNDIYFGATASEIKVVHLWVQEFDSTVSHFIIREDGDCENFLYKKLSRFPSMDRALVFFPYGIGTNGTYHSIRGLGYKIYPHVQVSNRLRCQLVDAALLASTILTQAESEEAADQMGLVYGGAVSMLSPGAKTIDRTLPNLSTAVIPAVSDMSAQLQSRAGSYTNNIVNDTRERTKFEVATQLDQLSRLSVTSLNLFYEPWQRLLREATRRILRSDYNRREPGGSAAREVRLRCLQRGVPSGVIDSVDFSRTTVVRSVGAGSQAARQLIYAELEGARNDMDVQGRIQYARDRAAARVGWDNVDKYIPPVPDARPTTDERFAEIENNTLIFGGDATARPNDLHTVHIQVHIGALQKQAETVDSGQVELKDAAVQMQRVHQHAVQHLEMLVQDATGGQEVNLFRQQLQQIGEYIYNGIKQLQAEQASAVQQQQSGAAPQQQGSGTDDIVKQMSHAADIQREMEKHRVRLKSLEDEHNLRMALRRQDAELKRALDDADAAAKILRSSPQSPA